MSSQGPKIFIVFITSIIDQVCGKSVFFKISGQKRNPEIYPVLQRILCININKDYLHSSSPCMSCIFLPHANSSEGLDAPDRTAGELSTGSAFPCEAFDRANPGCRPRVQGAHPPEAVVGVALSCAHEPVYTNGCAPGARTSWEQFHGLAGRCGQSRKSAPVRAVRFRGLP